MAVASDLPQMEDPLRGNSVILDANGKEIGLLTGNQRQLFVSEAQIAPVMKQAIIAIEDRRFYTNEGYDLRGIGRALWQDVVNQRVVQGGSTITQQFVKNALAAQNDRTLFVKLREAALAYQLTRKWSKERILRNYLNTIYFGNGAYGIESAAQTYFGGDHQGCEAGQDAPLRVPARAPRGGAAGRHRRLPDRLRPGRAPRRGPQAPQHRARPDAPAGPDRPGAPRRRRGREPAHARRHLAPARGHQVPLLHLLGQAAGRRQARRRPARRPARVHGRPDRQDHARLQGPGGGDDRDPQLAALRLRPARLDGRDREQDRHGAGDGRRRRLREVLVQPGHPGPAPARLVVQAVRAGRGAAPGHLARLDLDLQEEGLHAQGRREVRGQQLQRRLRGRDHAGQRDDELRQLRLRGARPQARAEEGRRDGAPARHPLAGLAQRRELARRPQAGRHPARHGARVRDVRPARRAHLRLPQPGQPAGPQGHADPRPGRDRGDRPRRQGRLRAARGRRPQAPEPQAHAARALARRSPTRSARSCRPS